MYNEGPSYVWLSHMDIRLYDNDLQTVWGYFTQKEQMIKNAYPLDSPMREEKLKELNKFKDEMFATYKKVPPVSVLSLERSIRNSGIEDSFSSFKRRKGSRKEDINSIQDFEELEGKKKI